MRFLNHYIKIVLIGAGDIYYTKLGRLPILGFLRDVVSLGQNCLVQIEKPNQYIKMVWFDLVFDSQNLILIGDRTPEFF